MTTPRTLTGMDALAIALLKELPTVRVDGQELPLEEARLRSYDTLDAVRVEWTPAPHPWSESYLRSLCEGRQSARRAERTATSDRRHAAREEYVAAAALAQIERDLYDAQNARLCAAGWRESSYTAGYWYRTDPTTGRAVRTNGRVTPVLRAVALASLSES